jgi:hypothetical protein
MVAHSLLGHIPLSYFSDILGWKEEKTWTDNFLREANPPPWAKYWKPHTYIKSELRGMRFILNKN